MYVNKLFAAVDTHLHIDCADLAGGVAGSHVASPRDRRDDRVRDGAVAAWYAGVFRYGHGLRDRRVRRRCDRSKKYVRL